MCKANYAGIDMKHTFSYIDKTEKMKQAFQFFPILYVEGAAATGKSTAVCMLLEDIIANKGMHALIYEKKFLFDAITQGFELYEDVSSNGILRVCRFDMYVEDQKEQRIKDMLPRLKDAIERTICYEHDTVFDIEWIIVFENLQTSMTELMADGVAQFLSYVSAQKNCKCICISREEPPKEFLPMLWERKMEQITMTDLMLTKNEVAKLLEQSDSGLDPDELYQETGGWAGCVDMMIRYSGNSQAAIWSENNKSVTIGELRKSYEIDTYIKEYILKTLSQEEALLIQRCQVCPWLDAALCRDVWGILKAEPLLDKLTRKGFLVFDDGKGVWRIAPLFRKQGRAEQAFWKQLGSWYEKHHYIKEALECLYKPGLADEYKMCMLKHYSRIPYSGLSYDAVLSWKEYTPESIYLRAMYYYEQGQLELFDREMIRLEERFKTADKDSDSWKTWIEVKLNLEYAGCNITLDAWLEMLKSYGEQLGEKISLYHIMGNSPSPLCGIRDLTDLFACTKKDENRKQRLFKEYLDDTAWECYRMAKIEYYLETNRADSILPEEQKWLMNINRVQSLYLMIRLNDHKTEIAAKEYIEELAEKLSGDEHEIVARLAQSLFNLYQNGQNKSDKLIRWLRQVEKNTIEVSESNYALLGYQIKGYMQLHQYEKAKKILSVLIPYIKQYRRGYLLAEHLYQQAIIRREEKLHGQALQCIIESFLISSQARYVKLYADYGKKGIEIIEEYIKWMQANEPERWHRKKKYQYGNVLRMPEADYMGVILRCIKHQSRISNPYQEDIRREHLTMMEMLILQDISRGMTNAEICSELNVKMPTVKTHIYSMYKKLGVNSRVQAILKGKEKGLLE